MNKTTDLTHKKVTVVGLGVTGQSCVRFALEQGADVSAMDSRSELTVPFDIPLFSGPLMQIYYAARTWC